MYIKRVHTLTLKNVSIKPVTSDCFLHDYEFMGIDKSSLKDEFEGQKMFIYIGKFSKSISFRSCHWCHEKMNTVQDYKEHLMKVHLKTMQSVSLLKFQEDMYREKLRLLRAGIIDHTYFVYLNYYCQMCDNRQKRGRGLCSIPESSRNKTRSINALRLSSDGFDSFWKKLPNIGYIIGKPL